MSKNKKKTTITDCCDGVVASLDSEPNLTASLSASLNYLGTATKADGSMTSVIATTNSCSGLTDQQAFDYGNCITVDSNTAIITDITSTDYTYYDAGKYVTQWPPYENWAPKQYSFSVDLAGVEWEVGFKLKTNRKRVTLKFAL